MTPSFPTRRSSDLLDAGDGVDGEQCVIGDHYVGFRRLDSGPLGEAVLTDRALVLADALAGGDADLPPRLIGHARHQFVTITGFGVGGPFRSEEHTSELQSLMRNSYAVFCLK